MFKKFILTIITSFMFSGMVLGMTTDPQAQKAIDFFNNLDKNHLDEVDKFYDAEVEFQDPVHKVHGVKAVRDYYAKLYGNVDSIRFEFTSQVNDGPIHDIYWKMFLKTPKLNGGDEYAVDGMSHIVFGANDKAISHRDYFDMGDFVYERIPVLKSIVSFIKKGMAN